MCYGNGMKWSSNHIRALLRGVNRRRVLIATLGVWLLALPPLALALNPAVQEGAQLIITDQGGETILGHGLIREGSLELTVSAAARDITLLVVAPDGSFALYEGVLSEDDDTVTITVYAEGISRDIGDVLRDADVQLTIRIVAELETSDGSEDPSTIIADVVDDVPDSVPDVALPPDEVDDIIDEILDEDELPDLPLPPIDPPSDD